MQRYERKSSSSFALADSDAHTLERAGWRKRHAMRPREVPDAPGSVVDHAAGVYEIVAEIAHGVSGGGTSRPR